MQMPPQEENNSLVREMQAELNVSYASALNALQATKSAGFDEHAAGKDPLTDPLILHVIAHRSLVDVSDGFAREYAAANPSTPLVTLRWLADVPGTTDTGVQDRLLKNPSTPEDILRRFMHRDDYARACLTRNPGAGDELILEAITDSKKKSGVDHIALMNPGVSDWARDYIVRMQAAGSRKRFIAGEPAVEA